MRFQIVKWYKFDAHLPCNGENDHHRGRGHRGLTMSRTARRHDRPDRVAARVNVPAAKTSMWPKKGTYHTSYLKLTNGQSRRCRHCSRFMLDQASWVDQSREDLVGMRAPMSIVDQTTTVCDLRRRRYPTSCSKLCFAHSLFSCF